MSRPPGASVGGQAVIEGVMMRAPEAWAVAVRRPDGVIEATQLPFEGRNKVAANVDAWRPASGETVWGLKAQMYLYF